ncbi:MAG TPA: hypothetical protein VHV51_07050 [Polyangiaceae bacterium]|nr:hypothetical protein [Polyangiaceae bacterium]
MFLRAVRITLVGALIAAVAVPACGNSSDSGPSGSGSGGSSGEAGAPESVSCGTATCNADTLTIPSEPPFVIPACCSDATANACGLDSSFLAMFGPTFAVACQPVNQPGTLDKACPNSAPSPVPNTSLTISFPGCCRENGTCGYELDNIGGLPNLHIGLGCVDSSPFLEGGAPTPCGGNAQAGAGGEGPTGSAGASGSAGETAAGGVSSN